jgi:septal ring factor EnvC (AmiA/AmiB activator)
MPSQSRDTRENQKKSYDQRIEERRADLEKKGISPKDFNKDKVYEHLKAKRRAIVNAIAAIEDSNARNEHQKEAAAEPAVPAPAASKEKKPKKEKPEKADKAVPAKTGD